MICDGYVSRVTRWLLDADEPDLRVTLVEPRLARSTSPVDIAGSGIHCDPARSMTVAVSEAIERHAMTSWHKEQFSDCPQKALPGPHLALDVIPHCSKRELLREQCPLRAPNADEAIRWTKSYELYTGTPTFLPAVMVFSSLARRSSERFWFPISTGCAAHINYEKAVVAGILECLERDALSITWLQQLRLPRITVEDGELYNSHCRPVLALSAQYRFYDAALDIPVPIVYCLRLSDYHPFAATIVACATGPTYLSAIKKSFADAAGFATTFTRAPRPLLDPLSFRFLRDGAEYMAPLHRRDAFRFLLETEANVELAELDRRPVLPVTLDTLVAGLYAKGHHIYVCDLSTDEALRAGLRVVRVVIPSLQPFSFYPAAQYLAHPRLYNAPLAAGYPSAEETHLNSWPQPFA